jgi:hypothetical protein
MSSSIDLTTLAAVRALLQGSEAIDDDVLAAMITAASRAILNETKRELIKGDEEARPFLSRGCFLDLGSSALRGKPAEVRLFTDKEEGSQVVLDASEYKLRPLRPEFGVYEWLELPATRVGSRDKVEVTITGDWGFESVPEDVAHWCGMTVVIWSRGDISAFSTTFNVEEGHIERPEDLPRAVKRALQHYQRMTVI